MIIAPRWSDEFKRDWQGMPRARRLAASGTLAFIAGASLAGQQVFFLAAGKPGLLIGASAIVAVAVLGFLTRQRSSYRWPMTALLLSAAAILGTLYWLEFLKVAELMHVGMFGVLGALVAPMRPVSAVTLIAAVAVGDELLQALLPYRVGSPIDVALNLASGVPVYLVSRAGQNQA